MKLAMFVIAALVTAPKTIPQDQYVVMVYPKDCIKRVYITERTALEVPVKDNGELNKAEAMAVSVGLDYNPSCSAAHFEVRRK